MADVGERRACKHNGGERHGERGQADTDHGSSSGRRSGDRSAGPQLRQGAWEPRRTVTVRELVSADIGRVDRHLPLNGCTTASATSNDTLVYLTKDL